MGDFCLEFQAFLARFFDVFFDAFFDALRFGLRLVRLFGGGGSGRSGLVGIGSRSTSWA